MDYTNGIIHLMRGDSYCKPIFINVGTKLDPIQYHLTDTDSLYFGLMEPNQAFEDAVLKKKYTCASDMDDKGNVLLTIEPNDTLSIPVGKYYYMIKLRSTNQFGKEVVKTIIPPTQFFIDGNNAKPTKAPSTPSGIPYEVSEVTLDGGEITDDYASAIPNIIFDGGEII